MSEVNTRASANSILRDSRPEVMRRVQIQNAASDSAEGYRHKGYAISAAEAVNPAAELVIDDKFES